MEPPENEESLQFFKKEVTPTCVSNIFLKKVLYHTPPSDNASAFSAIASSKFYENAPLYEAEEPKAHLQWRIETVRTLLHGTLGELVEAVAGEDGEIDSTHVNVLLNTYRTFATTDRLLELVQQRYQVLGEDRKMKQDIREAHRRTIRMLLLLWLDHFPDDFDDAPKFERLTRLKAYVTAQMPDSELVRRVTQRLSQLRLRDDQDSETDVVPVDVVGCPAQRLLPMDCARSVDCLRRPLSFAMIPADVFAQQLTYIDAELFKKVVPHHCMGAVWSGRDKKRTRAPSVYATVDQFNAVSYRVIATVLKWPDEPIGQRALIIDRWIVIAQELRVLKNFSSLKAIISGLQSNSVYRLRRVWEEVQREKMAMFEELSDIFSEHLNYMMCRELLMKEGTAKFADPESTNTIRGQLGQRKKGNTWTLRRKLMFQMPSVVHGTVPYLGTFLTDLTMVDAAFDDHVAGGLINFDKRRKEFEILAQVRLLQSAAQLYRIEPQHAFYEWFYSIRIYDEKESYELSCEIEPVTQTTPQEVKGHRKKSSLGFFSPRRPVYSMDYCVDSLANTSLPCLYIGSSPQQSSPVTSTPVSPTKQHRELLAASLQLAHSHSVGCMRSDSKASNESTSSSGTNTSCSKEFYVVKVYMQMADTLYGNHYKSILVTNSEHTKAVIQKILGKYMLEGKSEDFSIFQMLPERELQIPDRGNVFYALDTNADEIQFVVKRKSDLERVKKSHLRSKGKTKKYTL